jgi:hypothetical protein
MLSDEEKSTIARVKKNFEEFESDSESEEHEQLMKAHKADFEALEAIASNHQTELDSILALCHKHCMEKCEESKKAECEKKCEGEKKMDCMKKCDGYKYDAGCRKKCGGKESMAQKNVEVVIIEEESTEGEGIEKERKVMVYSGDHANMCKVHFLLMDCE